jgi:hypothetical protein
MPVCSAGLSCLTTFPGEPSTSEPGGTFIPAVTSAWAPMMGAGADFGSVENDSAHSDENLVAHGASVDDGDVPHGHPLPDNRGKASATCTMAPSWRLLRGPISMRLISPRRTAPYQTLASSPNDTSPMTLAFAAT